MIRNLHTLSGTLEHDTAGVPRKDKARSNRAQETITEFLDAAETLFAKHGFEGASIRAIAQQAGVQLGALHYYWGTKEALFAAVVERRLRPVVEERVRRLTECAAAGNKLELREVLQAYLEPHLTIKIHNSNSTFDELILRTITDPAPEVRRAFDHLFEASSSQFVQLLRKCCKHLDDKAFYWRLHAVMGSSVYFLTSRERIEKLSRGTFTAAALENGKDELVHGLIALLSAPMQPRPRAKKKKARG